MGFVFNCVWAECTESFFSYDGRFAMSSFFNSQAVVTKPYLSQCSSMCSVFNKRKISLICYACFMNYVGCCFRVWINPVFPDFVEFCSKEFVYGIF